MATVDAADMAEALELAWWTLRKAAGEDLAGWDLTILNSGNYRSPGGRARTGAK
jgi:hypothetical protein